MKQQQQSSSPAAVSTGSSTFPELREDIRTPMFHVHVPRNQRNGEAQRGESMV